MEYGGEANGRYLDVCKAFLDISECSGDCLCYVCFHLRLINTLRTAAIFVVSIANVWGTIDNLIARVLQQCAS